MQTRGIIVYAAVGAILGALAAMAVVWAFTWRDWFYGAMLVAALAGGLAASPGVLVAPTRRMIFVEPVAGLVLAAAGFAAAYALLGSSAGTSHNVLALSAVGAALAFSATTGALHGWRIGGGRLILTAAIFAGVGGVLALAAAAKVVQVDRLFLTVTEAGLVYGALMWGAVGGARRIFGVNIESFRVS